MIEMTEEADSRSEEEQRIDLAAATLKTDLHRHQLWIGRDGYFEFIPDPLHLSVFGKMELKMRKCVEGWQVAYRANNIVSVGYEDMDLFDYAGYFKTPREALNRFLDELGRSLGHDSNKQEVAKYLGYTQSFSSRHEGRAEREAEIKKGIAEYRKSIQLDMPNFESHLDLMQRLDEKGPQPIDPLWH